MTLASLLATPSELTDTASSKCAIVLMTRIRLARNLAGKSFPGWAKEKERSAILETCRDALAEAPQMKRSLVTTVDELSELERQILVERHLISRELSGAKAGAGVVISKDQAFSVMINEEDHLRIQTMRAGFQLKKTWAAINDLDTALEDKLDYAFSPTIGYLTACPTNLGTGMRASAMMHLPALVISSQMEKVVRAVNQLGMVVRGLFGEGSDASGSIFQISNQTTLGRSEGELLDYLVRVVKHVIEREEEARRVLLRDAGYIIEDKLWRAFGTLRYARSLSFEEAMNYLSGVRLAVGLKLISGLSVYTLNKLLIFSQLAHLGHTEGRALTESEANVARARYVRETLAREAE